MDKDKLFDLLGFNDTPEDDDFEDRVEDTINQPGSEIDDVSLTALDLDQWSIHKGHELNQLAKFSRLGLSDLEVADMFGAAFKVSPKLVDLCHDERRHQFVRDLLATPDYKTLHDLSKANAVISRMTAETFCKQWSELKAQDAGRDIMNQRRKTPPEQQALEAEMDCLAQATEAASESLQEADELLNWVSAMGKEPGDLNGKMDPEQTMQNFQRVKNDHQLRRIIELAGAWRLSAQGAQRRKVVHGYDDMTGITLGNDLARMLPSELGQLGDPDLELLWLRRYAERSCLSREYRGVEKLAKGPLVMMIDESMSMNGEKICNAKAMALAFGWIARHQKRWILLGSFASAYQGNYIIFPPGGWQEKKLMDWLQSFIGGGTDLRYPLYTIPELWSKLGCPKGRTDMCLLTDGQVDLPKYIKDSFLAFKKREQVRLYTLSVGCSAGPVEEVSDKAWVMQSISHRERGVLDVFSI